MIDPAIRRAVRRALFVAPLLCLVSLFCAADIVSAMVVGDQVELKGTHQAGIPLPKELRGTNNFQRVPDGTKATVIEVAPDGRWVKLSLPNGRTGLVSPRYVSSESAAFHHLVLLLRERNLSASRKVLSSASLTAIPSP
jgi:hypothetical protein